MKFLFTSYVYTKEFNSPEAWIERIKAYTGILEALAKKNEVISIEQINYQGDYRKDGVQYHFKYFTEVGRLLPFRLHRFIKKHNPDIIGIQSLHFPLQIIQLRLLSGNKARIIVQNHAEKPFKGIKRLAQKLADRYIDAYLFASHELGAEWVKNGSISSSKKIHEVMEVSSVFSPMDKAIARSRTGAEGSPIFLWVGRLDENKDPLNAVRAFLRFAAFKPSAKLYMIYHTDELLEPMQTIINLSKQKDAIHLIGKVPHSELQYWFNSADIILSGSHYEGSGTAICEAMSCGCVPIVTNIPSFRMITDNGRCGLLYEPGNENALLDALKLSCELDLVEKQKVALDYFKSNLSFEAIAKRIQEVATSL
jgi:glycosyltransferase involved in cell wall biosynthesis